MFVGQAAIAPSQTLITEDLPKSADNPGRAKARSHTINA